MIGLAYRDGCGPARIGAHSVIRAFTVIYGDVETGERFQTGHHALVREETRFGHHIVVGSGAVIDGHVVVGDFVKIESLAYIPTHTEIGSNVFIGPAAVLTNDKYPLRRRDEYEPSGPVIANDVTIGARAVVLPGVRVGEGAMVAAGAVVTREVPPWTLASGVPARISDLPPNLREGNRAKRW